MVSIEPTFYWFDYETFGRHPAFDRPSQFAGIRTDSKLRIIGDPLVIYCQPADDYLPDPEACLITGITPQQCQANGLPESEFIGRIRDELTVPGSCNVGYNNIRFDDEFTRHILFRNFYDPYEQEWKNGNSRWDLLDVVRLTRALRPEGIEWPHNEDGTINNKLDTITASNGIEHTNAHDALADVHATIAVARLIRDKKEKLFDYLFSHRDKHSVATMLNLRDQNMVVHVSGMIPSEFLHTSLVLPVARHPTNKNGVLVYDLRHDPEPFMGLEPEELALRMFSKSSELPDDMPRVPVKTVHTNRCPVLVPLSTLNKAAQQRTKISPDICEKFAEKVRKNKQFSKNLQSAFEEQTFSATLDLDGSLYSGGFFTASDKRAFAKIHRASPGQLGNLDLFYDDDRIPELLFRYRARNYPNTLSNSEQTRWQEDRLERISGPSKNADQALQTYLDKLSELKAENPDRENLLDELAGYARSLI